MRHRTGEYRLVAYARKNRKHMSANEAVIWRRLKGNALGVGFRRQEPIGPYIVDFVCIPLRLVIEIDGDSHDYDGPYDTKRSEYLISKGFRIIRYTKSEAWKHRDAVMEAIGDVVGEQQSLLSRYCGEIRAFRHPLRSKRSLPLAPGAPPPFFAPSSLGEEILDRVYPSPSRE